jgi:glycine/sarcosine N-methyltransferase
MKPIVHEAVQSVQTYTKIELIDLQQIKKIHGDGMMKSSNFRSSEVTQMSSSPALAYDQLSSNYDRFVNWKNRLNFELPFLTSQLATLSIPQSNSPRILDAACATGMHTLALAKMGYKMHGADISSGMIAQAHKNAKIEHLSVNFQTAMFGNLSQTFGSEQFDALLCLGNSLPHVSSLTDLHNTLVDFSDCLRPDGMLILQNRNFEAVLAHKDRWMEPQSFSEGGEEWVFVRFYDFEPDGSINFHILTLHKSDTSNWTQTISSTRLLPIDKNTILTNLQDTGFTNITFYGGLDGNPYDLEKSGNLVVVARKE